MKKLNYFLLGLAGLTLASCSQDDLLNTKPDGEGNFHITVNLPSNLATRATTNDGLQANSLAYYIYDMAGGTPTLLYKNTASFNGNISTTVNLNLIPGQEYKITFFAYAEGAFGAGNVYSIDETAGVMTVDYSRMESAGYNDDIYDCFANVIATGVIGKDAVSSSVTLYRPMAQINWGTNDFSGNLVQNYFGTPKPDNVYPYLQSQLSANVYTQFSLLDNNVVEGSSQSVDVPFLTQPLNIAGNALLGFPVNGGVNKYVAMQYILAPQSESVVDLNLSINNGNGDPTDVLGVDYDVNVPNAPVQANYQTNIYGSLLSENVSLEITKNKNWTGINDVPLGDQGTRVSEGIYVNNETYVITITNEEGLKTYAETMINYPNPTTVEWATGSKWSNYYTVLANDITLTGNWTPFPNNEVTFDGQGNTISGLTVVAQDGASAGFMTTAQGTVQNIVFENANITGNYKAGVLAGDGLCARISNITVNGAKVTSTPWLKGTTYDDGNNVGGVVGYLSAESTAWCNDCEVNNLTITAYAKVGGVVGYANGPSTVTGNKVTNATVTANMKLENGEYVEIKPFNAGEICGGWSNSAIVDNNTPINVSVTTIDSEGNVAATVASQEALANAVNTDNATVVLQPGSYNMVSVKGTGVTITGTKDAVIVIPPSPVNLPAGGYNDLTIKGITLSCPTTGNYYGIQGDGITFEDCDINGMMFGYGTDITYKNCNWTSTNWCMWTYTAQNLVFDGCTFNCEVGKGFNVYNETVGEVYKVTFNNCKFIATEADNGKVPGDGKAAIMVKKTPYGVTTFDVTINNCTATGFSTDTNTEDLLWSYENGASFIVTVDGKVTTSTDPAPIQ